MNVLHFIASIDPATGGPVEGLRQRCNIYRAAGYHVEIASLDSPEFVQTLDFPAKLIGLGPGRGTYGYTARAVPWLKENVRNFDVVFVNGVWNYNTLAAYRALAGTDIPWAIFTHGMMDPYFKRQFPLKHLKKSLYWHTQLAKAFRSATAVLFTCEEEKLLARQSFSRYRVREAVVPYGTFGPDCDTTAAAEDFLAQFPALRGKRLAISLGRIHPKKGTDILIQSFAATLARDPAWHLIIAGPDQTGWQKELEALATTLGISNRITWTGSLHGAHKWGAFAASEIFALPSHQENFGIVVAEAMSCSLPVLISNKVNIWREIAAAAAGLVADDTVAGTTASFEHYASLSSEEAATLRANSKACFSQSFDFNATSKMVIQNVEQLARSTPRYKPPVADKVGTPG